MTAIAPSSRTLAVVRLAVLAIFLVVAGIAMLVFGTDELRSFIEVAANSRWGLAAFIAAYAVAVVLLLPGTAGTLSAGALFGFTTGAFAAVAGGTIGAIAAFFISRAMGRDGAQHLLGNRLTRIDEWIGQNDFVSILLLRLMPIVPFSALNYAAGLAAVRPSRYVAATSLGLIPGVLLASALGDSASDPTSSTFVLLLIAMGLAIALSINVARRVHREQVHREQLRRPAPGRHGA